jgi:UDP-N-acetylmuramyl pentapeptide phosphotransferase/UDP-N-acetylglucosamine-1-phosphate transferase
MTLFLVFTFFLAVAITWVVIPSVIRVAELKHLFDEPDNLRKTHIRKTPTLGGVAIFAGLIISFSLAQELHNLFDIKYMIPALMILFFAGVKDDVIELTAAKKFAAQFLSAFLIVYLGNIKINSFYGMFGLQEIPFAVAVVFTILVIVTIINCYNLIDGIDGLAGSQGMLSAIAFGSWFVLAGHWSLAFLAFALAGSLLGFLYFNWSPAKIFMGDTGAMLIGFILSMLAIHFIELNKANLDMTHYWVHASPAVAIGFMAIPIFDMLRVFIIRIIQRRSPFRADRTHMHHILMDLGLSHRQVSSVLFLWGALVIGLCIALRDYKSSNLLGVLICVVFVPSMILFKLRNKKISKLS